MFKREKPTATIAINIIASLLILLPAALAFLYVREFGVNVPYWDDWRVVPLLDKLATGTLKMSDLWPQHNEHRIFFPLIAQLLLGSLTKFNTVAEMYLTGGFFLVTLIVLLLAFKDSVKTTLCLFIPISFLMFSTRQHENMLWGFQISFAIACAFAVLTLYFLYVSAGYKRFRGVTFLSALVSATVASFSAAQGLLVWPAGLLQLFVSPMERSAKKVMIGVWSLTGLGEWIFYFVGYVQPDWNPSLGFVLQHPIAGIGYSLTLFGSSLVWQQNFAFVGGLLLTGLVVVSLLLIYKDRKLGEHSFWIALLFFSFLTMASITIGRSEGGAPISRYTTFSILAVVSVYVVLTKLVLERKSRLTAGLIGALSALILLSIPISYWEGIKEGAATKATREQAAFILSTYESQPDELLVEHLCPTYGCGVHPFGQADADTLRERADILKRLGYNVFSESRAQGLPPSPSGLSPVPPALFI
jgi:hypothetical protein